MRAVAASPPRSRRGSAGRHGKTAPPCATCTRTRTPPRRSTAGSDLSKSGVWTSTSISNAVMSDETAIAAVPHQRSGEELVESAAQAFFAVWAAMTATVPGGSYVEEAGVVRARMGLPVPAFNGVWGIHRQGPAPDRVAPGGGVAAGGPPPGGPRRPRAP